MMRYDLGTHEYRTYKFTLKRKMNEWGDDVYYCDLNGHCRTFNAFTSEQAMNDARELIEWILAQNRDSSKSKRKKK
ncbi:MAG: hypothetical protein OXG15_10155 [Gammaproteobacteria bacterium]|nr:hypothetical protein [Gammaproteobacteria bacterium]